MKTVYAIIFWIGVIVMCSDCDNLTVFVVSKLIAGLIMYISGRLLENAIAGEKLNKGA